MKTMVTPSAFSARDQLAEPVDVAAGQGRGRLVEQQDARLAVDGAGDLDLLLHGKVEVADLGARVDAVEAERSQDARATARSRRAPAHHAQ